MVLADAFVAVEFRDDFLSPTLRRQQSLRMRGFKTHLTAAHLGHENVGHSWSGQAAGKQRFLRSSRAEFEIGRKNCAGSAGRVSKHRAGERRAASHLERLTRSCLDPSRPS